MTRKRWIKLALLLVALFPFVRAAGASWSETFTGFYAHPDYTGWVWSHHYGQVSGVTGADYHIRLSPASYSGRPAGDCALELRGNHLKNNFHHEPLPNWASFNACDESVGHYMSTGYQQRSVLCQVNPGGFAVDVTYSPDPGCP